MNGQELVCGTKLSQKEIETMKDFRPALGLSARTDSETQLVGITAHIIRPSSGVGGLNEFALTDAIDNVNAFYQNAGLAFFIFNEINYIDNDTYYNFQTSDQASLTSANNVSNTINIYFTNSVTDTDSQSSLCGYAYFPGGPDVILMANSCAVNGSTLPHEIGHYFTLYHTHGKTNSQLTDELVNGQNCSTAGDELCDTPADPQLSSNVVDPSCNYTGNATDANDMPFDPNPRNIMSYSRKECRIEFSNDQYQRMSSAYSAYRQYLVSKSYLAIFDADGRTLCEGSEISFVNNSVGAVSYEWSFEGGTPSSSNEVNPKVLYENSGTYDVSLTITEEGGDTDTKTFTDYITVTTTPTSSITQRSTGFEGTGINEEIINEDDDVTFTQVSDVNAPEGSSAAFINMYAYSSIGEEDFLIAATLNTSTEKLFSLSFDYAYARYDEDYFDGLSIVYQDGCGDWFQVWSKFGSDLATAIDHGTSFIPESYEWSSEEVYFSIPDDMDVARIAFRTHNGYGNNLFLDNVNVQPIDLNFSVDLNSYSVSCNGLEDGSITALVNGEGEYTYSFNGGDFSILNVFSNLEAGNYNVTVKNEAAIELSNSITISEPSPISVNYEVTSPTCPGENDGFVNLEVNGGTGSYSIRFDGGAFSSETSYSVSDGKFDVYIEDGKGCSFSDEIEIEAQFIAPPKPNIVYVNGSFRTSLISGQTIQWYRNGTPVENGTSSQLSTHLGGSYSAIVSNGNCSTESDPLVIVSADDITDELKIYPNPVRNALYFEFSPKLAFEISSIRVLDLTGKTMFETKQTNSINLERLNSGVYLIELIGLNSRIISRIIKE